MAESKGGAKGKLLYILAALVLAAGAAAGSYFFFGRSGGHAAPEPPPLATYEMGTVVVNLNDDTTHYLRIGVVLAYRENKELAHELDVKQALLKDRLIYLLRQRTLEDVRDVEHAEKCREDILKEMNRHLKHGKIEAVYVTEYLVQ
ncbi:MAG: flagellar basal body-associated FliL family protein [Desulfotomaculales bacterium]